MGGQQFGRYGPFQAYFLSLIPSGLTPEEKRRALAQVREEAERQRKCGNLVRVYADIQGERLAFGQSAQ